MGVIPPWADLPQELLSAIAECLRSNPIDTLSFRSVCKSWYSSSISLPKLFHPLPLITPSPPYPLRNPFHFLFCGKFPHNSVLSVTVVYAIHPPLTQDFPSSVPRAFLLFVDQSNPQKVSIRHPFSHFSYSLPINFPGNLNLLTFNAFELGRFYNLSNSMSENAEFTRLSLWSQLVRKVVLFSKDNGPLFVVVLSTQGKLGLLRLGSEDKNGNLAAQTQWEILHEGIGFRFDDIVDFKGRLLGIDRRGRVYDIEIGCSSLNMFHVIIPAISGGGGRRKRLVESLGCLYLVVRSNVREEDHPVFKVYKINEDSKKWVEVTTLGDQIFLFGLEFSLSASAEKLHGLFGKNCVLFKKESFLGYDGYDGDSLLFRNLKSKDLYIGVWHLEDAAHLGVIGSYPNYANILWPPPAWIWPNDCTERVGTLLSALGRLQVEIPDFKKLEDMIDGLSLRQQRFAVKIMKLGIKMKETLSYARCIDQILEQIKIFAVTWQRWLRCCKAVDLHNQGGTSTLGTEESHVSVSPFKILHSTSKSALLSMETKLHPVILRLEEYTSIMEGLVNSYKFSAFVDDMMGSSHGAVE